MADKKKMRLYYSGLERGAPIAPETVLEEPDVMFSYFLVHRREKYPPKGVRRLINLLRRRRGEG